MSDILVHICNETRAEIARRQAATPLPTLRSAVNGRVDRPRGFARALKEAHINGHYGLIAEFKRKSPSGGEIRPGASPEGVARAYLMGGAACISVLTDTPYFGGSLKDLAAVRQSVQLPLLRKDFILDPWQIYESRLAGADAILLIMAALSDHQARELEEAARELDMDVLAEVHDRAELERALGLQTNLVGINNRNLKTLQTDLATTVELAHHVPPDRMLITESGIRDHQDVRRLAAAGAYCMLVGESLLRHDDIVAATKSLLGRLA